MIKVSARPPLERRDNIINWRKELGWSTSKVSWQADYALSPHTTETPMQIRAWNILVDLNMLSVKGWSIEVLKVRQKMLKVALRTARVLNPPPILYNATQRERANGGYVLRF